MRRNEGHLVTVRRSNPNFEILKPRTATGDSSESSQAKIPLEESGQLVWPNRDHQPLWQRHESAAAVQGPQQPPRALGRFYDLAEQRARWLRGVGGAGVGAVPLDILEAYFLILFDTDLWAQRGISGP